MGILLTSQESATFGKTVHRIIDGQQRSVTLRIFLAALEHHLSENFGKTHPRLGKSKLAQIDVQESDARAFELALDGEWRSPEAYRLMDSRILKCYTYFRFMLWLGEEQLGEEEPIIQLKKFKYMDTDLPYEKQWEQVVASKLSHAIGSPICDEKAIKRLVTSTLESLTLFMVMHEPTKDEPEAVIFDTLNGMRMELAPLDHVRTHVFVRIDDFEDQTIYKNLWEPAEMKLRQISNQGVKAETAFVYDYLIAMGESEHQGTIKTAKGGSHFATMLNRLNLKTSAEYQTFIREQMIPYMNAWPVVVRFQDNLNTPSGSKTIDEMSLKTMSNIKDLSQGPANPLILHLLVGYARDLLTSGQLQTCLELIENYVARQFLGDRALSPLRAKLMGVTARLAGSFEPETLKAALLSSGWVTDKEIFAVIERRDWSEIKTSAIAAVLRGAERKISGPAFKFFRHGNQQGQFSLEHIYPRNPAKWKNDLRVWGSDPNEMDSLRETLGNYAFVTPEHNSKVGNSEFAKKLVTSRMEDLSPDLGINKSWVKKQKWTPADIRARSRLLAEKALSHWIDYSDTSQS